MRKSLSAETIYAALYVLPRRGLRRELLTALRQVRKARASLGREEPTAAATSRTCH